jgi:hypothetical protein
VSPQSSYFFNAVNRRLILLLSAGHLLWSCLLFGLCATASLLPSGSPWLSAGFVAVQFYAAAQLLLPALLFEPQPRQRGFYLVWGGCLAVSIWLLNQLVPTNDYALLAALKSGLLLLTATFIGAALARYVRRLWEIVPICLVMTAADLVSWYAGPTAGFAAQLQAYYQAPRGTPPLIDMLLVKLAFPGLDRLAPVFGISDWIMVVFFALVAQRFALNDNLLGAAGSALARRGRVGGYLPVPVVALLLAVVLAQLTGFFLPALPLIALITLCWYGARFLLRGFT